MGPRARDNCHCRSRGLALRAAQLRSTMTKKRRQGSGGDCVNRSRHHQELLMNRLKWLAAGVAAMLMLACSSQRDPAQEAIAKIDSSLDAIHDSATKYSPDMLQSVQSQVGALKQ